MTQIRKPAVAGLFYPAGAAELRVAVREMLDSANAEPGTAPKALIVPHAGYRYSGPVAASAYARLAPFRSDYRRVVLLGPCHRVPLRGIARSGASAFETPLGAVPLDLEAERSLDSSVVGVSRAAHRDEHSLEVQLPFLQTVLERFSLVPLVIGDAEPDAVEAVLDGLWGGKETLLVVSSDLSHYLPHARAALLDRSTCRAIERLDPHGIDHQRACGAAVIGGLLMAAAQRGLAVETVDLRNSGDIAGDRSQVVGYGSWIFAEDETCVQAA
ncbi:MAG: AmmeMemoRadiSam system protein B [Xanthomonadales bacterium]|nr:AmmeMemoRadiSam system protein B [Xanthomonadales bacterium]